MKPLKGSKNSYRPRVRDWRIIFSYPAKNTVLIEKIVPQSKVYKGMYENVTNQKATWRDDTLPARAGTITALWSREKVCIGWCCDCNRLGRYTVSTNRVRTRWNSQPRKHWLELVELFKIFLHRTWIIIPTKKYVCVHVRGIYLYTLISRRGHKILIFYSFGYTSIHVIKYQHREDAPFLCDPTTECLIPHKKLLIWHISLKTDSIIQNQDYFYTYFWIHR